MDVYWLEQADADVPEQNHWLSPNEARVLGGLRFAKRQVERRLGIWTAKRALALCLTSPVSPTAVARLEIRHAPSGVPEVFFDDRPVAVTISISHRSGKAICAVAPAAAKLGCDLEQIEPRSKAFVSDFFTAEEQWLVARHFSPDRPWLLTLLWSAKESALKALGEGLRLDTRCVVVRPVESGFDLNGWSPLQVRHAAGHIFHGWWQKADDMVRTLVAVPAPASPIRLIIAEDFAHPYPGHVQPAPPTKSRGDLESHALQGKA
jgi:4'-phosphopantetheinyl transferase